MVIQFHCFQPRPVPIKWPALAAFSHMVVIFEGGGCLRCFYDVDQGNIEFAVTDCMSLPILTP